MAQAHGLLPYRADPADLHRLLAALARGRTADQIRTLGFSPKSFDGVIATAKALAMIRDKGGELTDVGRSYALMPESDRRPLLLRRLRSYLPYSLVLDAVFLDGGPQPTPLEWLETWWAAHHFGSSESNRVEAAPVFAKLVEAAGLGRYVQGRKGHPSRVEWLVDAGALPPPVSDPALHQAAQGGPIPPEPAPESPADPLPAPAARPQEGPENGPRFAQPGVGTTHLHWVLEPGIEVDLRLPANLPRRHRERVMRLIQVLLEE